MSGPEYPDAPPPEVPEEFADAYRDAYRRALESDAEDGELPEVPTSATGHFRFFAGDGEWTLRTLAPKSEPVDTPVVAATGSVAEVQVLVTT